MAAKYLALASELRRLCTRLRRQGQTKLPSEPELAEKTGYSRQTVRRALELLEGEGLIVRLRGSGTYLARGARGRNRRVAVLCCSDEAYLYPRLLRDMEAVCLPEGYAIERHPTGNLVTREREALTALLADPPAGILMEAAKGALPSPNLDLLERIGALGIPLVFFHAAHAAPVGAPCIRDDNEGGARLLVRRLLGGGHRQIAGIFKSDDPQGAERYRGFASELLRALCPLLERSILWYDSCERETLASGGGAWLDDFVRTRLAPCTAVVCYNDEIAYALIGRLLAAGLRVPEDVAVVSFDDSHLCRLCSVPITSLAHERHQMGAAAATALLALLRDRGARSLSLPWTLHVRESG